MQTNWLFTANPVVFSEIFRPDHVHTGCNMGFLGMLNLNLYMHRKLTLFPENLLNTFSGVSVCSLIPPNANNQRKKWAERQASLEKPRSGYLLCDMRGGLFLYPVSKHTGWDLWQCTLNSAISFPIETSKWHTSMCWAIHVFSYSIRNYSSAEWEYYEPGCLVSKVGHSNFGLHLNRH